MKRITALTLILLTSCVQSKINYYSSFPKIVAGEQIMIMSIGGVSEKFSYNLFESAKKQLVKTNHVVFLPEQEYHLIGKGIDREMLYATTISDSTKIAISKAMKTRYILNIGIVSSKQGGSYGSYTELELKNNPYGNVNSETNKATLLFTLTDMKTHLTEYKFSINTTISPLSINDENGGERNINLSTQFGAIVESFEKGIRKLKREIIKI